ncbi:retropepsin-like aspartic protease, partial [Spirosoma sp.]|uniref:retropepsin-like aspartic protease n=1 Tax=Spirosoma sp. TaxID=1899569 RepID=UPI003B3B86A2
MPFNTVHRAVLPVFALILILISSTSAQKLPQNIPLIRSENLLYVKAYINGRGPFTFMLDLGSATTARIDNRLAKELGLNVVGFEENSVGTTVKREFLVGVDKFSLGQITHSKLKLVVQDFNLKPKQVLVNGIIGRDFFYNYLLTIDGPNRQLIIAQDRLDARAKGVLAYTKAFLVLGKVGPTD